jgi:hypothetical protein
MPYSDGILMIFCVDDLTDDLPDHGYHLRSVPLSGTFGYETYLDNLEEDWNGIAAAAD